MNPELGPVVGQSAASPSFVKILGLLLMAAFVVALIRRAMR